MSLGRGFSRLWAGNAAGNLSDGIAFVAIPLLAVHLTDNAVLIAGLAAVYAAVRLAVVVPMGVLVDRFDRRSILWTTNAARAALLVAAAAAFAAGLGSIALLYAVFAAVGVIETAADNAALSIVPSIVPTGKLDRANGRISAAQLVADEFVGPPLGGFLFGLGIAVPVLAAGGLYAAAGLFFLALPRAARRAPLVPPGASRPTAFREALEGARWLRGHRLLGWLAVIGGIASVAYMMPFSILVLYARDTLGLDPTGYGVILAVSALGGLVGSFVTAPVRARFGYGPTIVASLLLGAASMVALAFTRSPWLAGAFLATYILHSVVWGICVSSLRQRLVPDRLRGRVNASSRVLGLIGLTVGALAGGAIAAASALFVPFVVSGVLFACCALIAWFVFRPAVGRGQ